jgi:hypothetical protein
MGKAWVNGKFITSENKKSENWKPAAEQERKLFGSCADCFIPIYDLDTIWYLRDRLVCFDCRTPYQEAGRGHMDAANLVLPDSSLEG